MSFLAQCHVQNYNSVTLFFMGEFFVTPLCVASGELARRGETDIQLYYTYLFLMFNVNKVFFYINLVLFGNS